MRKNASNNVQLYKLKDCFPSDFPIAIGHGRNYKSQFNEDSDILYQREFWKVFYINSGEGILVINSNEYKFGPGFVCLIHPNDLTTFKLKTEFVDIYNIMFSKKALLEADELKSDYGFFTIFYDDFNPRKKSLHDQLHLLDSNRGIQAQIKKMEKEYLREDLNSGLMLRFQLMELLILLTRHSSREFRKKRRSSFLGFIRNYIENHYNIKFDYKKIAKEARVTEIYLCSLYKKHTGESIGETIHKVRMKKAKEMLINSEASISEICYSCGFNDLSYFYRAFKKCTGTSPGKFRKH